MDSPSNGGCAYFINEDGSYIQWSTVNVAAAGTYDLTFAYATNAATLSHIIVNGGDSSPLNWLLTGNHKTTDYYDTSVDLNAGDNTIRILHQYGWLALDYMDVTLDVLSVDDFSASAIKMYPNPTTGMLNFGNLQEIQNIALFDLTGKALKAVNNQNYIDISSLDSGIYFVRIELPNNQSITRKVIKE